MAKKKGSAAPAASAEKTQASAIKEAMRAAGAVGMLYSVRRRMPPAKLWSWWRRNISHDSVDDIQEYCYEEGGKTYEYRIDVHDAGGQPVRDPDDSSKGLGPFQLPAVEDAGGSADGEDIKVRRDELRRRRALLEQKRQQLALEKEEAELAVLMGEVPLEEEEEEETNAGGWDKAWGPPPWVMKMYQKDDSTLKIIAALSPVLVELVKGMRAPETKAADPLESILKILPLMKGESFHPKDFMNMLSPMVAQMGQMSAEGMKALMGSMADMDSSFRERVLDLVMATGQGNDDTIEKWRRALGLVKDSISDVGGTILTRILGRSSILDPNKRGEIKVPKLGAGQKPPAEAPAAGSTPAAEKVNGTAPPAAPGAQPAGGAPAPNTEEENVKKVAAQRAKLLLAAMTEEMLLQSDPLVVADKLEEVYLLLPLPVRSQLEAGDVGDAFDVLRVLMPAEVDAFIDKVGQDKSGARKAWVEEFMQSLLSGGEDIDGEDPDEEEEPEDDDDEEEEEEEGEPGPKPPNLATPPKRPAQLSDKPADDGDAGI